jgi:hypothetical protein
MRIGPAECSVALRDRRAHALKQVAPQFKSFEARRERQQPFFGESPPKQRDFDLRD